jgi:GAF domain-containing protein/CheY-like chemotaxis protein/two-component sensor histidine kinase
MTRPKEALVALPSGLVPRSSATARPTILVADDHPHNLIALQAALEPLGEPFEQVSSGAAALRLLESGDFAVGLLDVRMPDLSGIDVAARLRERSIQTPIIFLTAAEDTTELRRHGYDSGAVDFLLKPFEPRILRAKVRVFVELHRQRRELEQLSESHAAERLLARQRVQILANVAAELSPLLTTSEVAQVLASAASKQLQASTSHLYLLSEEGSRLVLTPTGPGESSRPTLDSPVLEESLRRIALGADPVWLNSGGDLLASFPRLSSRDTVEAVVALPLRLANRSLGVLLLGFEEPKKAVASAQEFLITLSAQVAGALERARLIDNERAAYDELQKITRRARLMADVGTLLSSSLDHQGVLRQLSELLVPTIADWCAVDVLDELGNVQRLAAFHSDPQKVALVLELERRYPTDPQSPRGVPHVLATGQSEWAAEIPEALLASAARDAEHLRLIHTLSLHSYVIVPLHARGRILGALTLVYAESARCYALEDVRFIEELAARAALSLDNALLFQEQVKARGRLERQARHASLVGDVGSALAQNANLAAALQLCAAAIVRHLDAAFARIWTRNQQTEMLELRASAGMYTHLDGAHGRVPMGQFKIGRIARDGVAHLTNEVQSDPWVSDPEWARREGMASFAGYPLIIEGKVIGVMALFARKPLADDTLTALAAIADSVAIGIERTRADERAREERDTLEVVNLVGRALAAELDQEKLVQAIADYGTRLAGAAFGAFFYDVVDASGQTNMACAVSGAPREAFSRRPVPEGIRGSVSAFAGQDVVRVDDIRADPDHGHAALQSGMPEGYPLASYLAVPVASRGALIGRLFFGHPQPGVFSERSEMLVCGVAAQAAIAMDNARLFREAQRFISELDKSNKDLDQFAYVASHDLKAPLRGIANLSQWLEEDLGAGITDEGKEQLRLMRNRVHRMEGLINGILAYSRAGRTRSKLESVAVDKLLVEVIELSSAPESARIEIGPDMPVLVTERVPLQQVFMNLVGNALKHAKRADPHVRVNVLDRGDTYQFSIQDNGPGIAPEYHQRIWGIFQTLEPRDTVEGTGIGLSVVKKIVESKRGSAWVEAQLGAGATFHFTWPKAEREMVKSA